jgi:hypothetical protein
MRNFDTLASLAQMAALFSFANAVKIARERRISLLDTPLGACIQNLVVA